VQLEELRMLYARHIEVEDGEIFPLAGKTLNAGELELIGKEMQARRGVGECGG
jgi:hemerythrin-like domain-containing protein